MAASAFKAAYSDWKLVKTRGVVQIVFEVPLADADAVYDVVGGMPDAARERWFGIAPLHGVKEATVEPKARRDFRDLPPAQQAALRCNDATFRAFLNEERGYQAENADDAAEAVRELCAVASRAELSSNHAARVIWHQLDSQYQAWKAVEHA